jgi:tetratricopeptide (TPR) repeat protein
MRHLVVVLLLVASRAASADVAPCKADVAQYEQDPKQPYADELLYNSAVCFEQAHDVATAIATWDRLVKSHPASKLAGKALIRTAMDYVAVARLDEAATRFEQYAARYAGEKDARDFLGNAITLRTALGDRARQVADTKLWLRMYAAKDPTGAAELTLAVVGAYDAPADQVKALREYLTMFGSKGGRDRLALVFERLGDALWAQSCPVKLVDGLCVKVVADKAPHCGPNTTRREAVPRTALRADALIAYDRAVKVVEEAGLTDPVSLHAAAMARLARADDLFETLLARRFPSTLDMTSFEAWVDGETRQAQDATRMYDLVLATKDPAASIAAAARLGQLNDAFAATLLTGDIPATVRTGAYAADKVKAYCDQMSNVAAPLHENAREAFGVCSEKAVELGVFDEHTALCRRELGTTLAEIQPELTLAIPKTGGPLDVAIGQLDTLRAMTRTDPARTALAAEATLVARRAAHGDTASEVVVAMIALEQDGPGVARVLLEQALLGDDKSALLYAAGAVIDARRGDWTRAYAFAERAVAAEPRSEVALRISGLVAAHVGVFDTARDRLASVKDQSYEVVLARGIAAHGLGDSKAARAYFEQAIRLDPARPQAHVDLSLERGR